MADAHTQPAALPQYDFAGASFARVSDVLAFLYEAEHAGPYCSPAWTRSGTKVVLAVIVQEGPTSIAALLRLLHSPHGLGFSPDPDRDPGAASYWERTRSPIATEVEARWVAGAP